MEMDVKSRLKMIMEEGLKGIRGPLHNADDHPSVPMLFIMIAREVETHKMTHKFIKCYYFIRIQYLMKARPILKTTVNVRRNNYSS